jgi:HAD superfamily hydrolase (TIGR01490 family)
MILALFDVDDTIIRGDSMYLFGAYVARRHGLSLSGALRFTWAVVRYVMGLEGASVPKGRFFEMICTGLTEAELQRLAERFVRDTLMPLVYPQAKEQIHWHQRAGHEVLIISASVDLYISRLADQLGIKRSISTKLKAAGDRTTGWIAGVNCKGRAKLDHLMEKYIEADVNWRESFMYSDSVTDLPLFERVGRPIVVNPDRKLSRIARRRGWTIARWD